MPKPPLILSPGRRSLAIGGVMLGLFIATLALAWVVTGAPLQRIEPPEPVRVAIGDAQVSMNASWKLVSSTPSASDRPALWRFSNQAAPSEQLQVIRINTSTPQDPETVLQVTANDLLSGQQSLQQIGARTADSDHHQAVAFIVVTLPKEMDPAERRVFTNHAIAVATPDGLRFWVYHLTDHVAEEAWSDTMLQTWDRVIRSMLASASYDS